MRMNTKKIKSLKESLILLITISALSLTGCSSSADSNNIRSNSIRIATFEVDATPHIGEPLAYTTTKRIEMPLSARGVVLIGNDDPIVMLAVDWIGVKSKATEIWKTALAKAANTTLDRVTIHSLHQHDAPRADFKALDILEEYGIDISKVDNRDFVERVIGRSAGALHDAIENNLQTITHVGTGTATVEKVASNRRQVNREGKEFMGRMSSGGSNVENQRAPVGVIDPEVRMVSFWNGDESLGVISYYTSHPQSFYRTGGANPDFVGIARAAFEEEIGVKQVHFNGAGGNIAAGKWNNGWTEKRQILADRLKKGMIEAWEQTVRTPVDAGQLEWRIEPVALPLGEHLVKEDLEQRLREAAAAGDVPVGVASDLAWVRRTTEGDDINLTSLRVGPVRTLHTPGELAVEYQLYANSLYPDDFIANASYSDYDPGYISTEIQYKQVGYEASHRASNVAPQVEQVLLSGIKNVLDFEAFKPDATELAERGYRLERSAFQYGYDAEHSWVNGRAGVIPAEVSINPINKPSILFTTHGVEHSGPDVLQGLYYFRSRDLGLSWEGPFEESVFERESVGDGIHDRLVSDFTPQFHAETETMLGIGHSSTYEENLLIPDQMRAIAYATFNEQTQRWLEWQHFELPDELSNGNLVAASGRRVDLEDGSILFPVYAKSSGGERLNISVVRSHFDGESLEYIEHGNTLTVDAGLDLHEPSLVEFNGSYYLTFRNDEQVYVTHSDDGIIFDDPQPWRFDDGQSILDGDNSYQHWVTHNGTLYLAYTRGNGEALFLAQVDPEELNIKETTGQVIIPAERDGHLANLDIVDVSENVTWVIATEWIQPLEVGAAYAKDNLIHIARLNWIDYN